MYKLKFNERFDNTFRWDDTRKTNANQMYERLQVGYDKPKEAAFIAGWKDGALDGFDVSDCEIVTADDDKHYKANVVNAIRKYENTGRVVIFHNHCHGNSFSFIDVELFIKRDCVTDCFLDSVYVIYLCKVRYKEIKNDEQKDKAVNDFNNLFKYFSQFYKDSYTYIESLSGINNDERLKMRNDVSLMIWNETLEVALTRGIFFAKLGYINKVLT